MRGSLLHIRHPRSALASSLLAIALTSAFFATTISGFSNGSGNGNGNGNIGNNNGNGNSGNNNGNGNVGNNNGNGYTSDGNGNGNLWHRRAPFGSLNSEPIGEDEFEAVGPDLSVALRNLVGPLPKSKRLTKLGD